MPGYVGFQVALDLASVFPVKELVETSFQKFVRYATELRKSGSDIVVEVNLAEVFGGGKVSPELEAAFKSKVQVHNIKPLYNGSDIELQQGPGPTMLLAFKDKTNKYLATVITLSMLSSFQGAEQLASMIDWALNKRFEFKMPNSSLSPGYEGILSTLNACNSQSAGFLWKGYTEVIEDKLRSSIPDLTLHSDYLRMTPALLLGCVDFLYSVQSLPEHRRVVVASEIGCVPLIVWAHFILGLTVIITGCPGGDVTFSNNKEEQVFITWTGADKEKIGELLWPDLWADETRDPDPLIKLLDSDLNVILACEPGEDNSLTSFVEERHPLEGYGTTYLRRVFNTNALTLDKDDIYPEAVGLITGLALSASSRMSRDVLFRTQAYLFNRPDVHCEQIHLENWRILESADLIFNGIIVDIDKVVSYEETCSKYGLVEGSLPNTFEKFLNKVKPGSSTISPAERLIKQVVHLAKIVLLFAHVVNLKKCATMPLILKEDHPQLSYFMSTVAKDPSKRGFIGPEEVFHGIVKLLSSTVLDSRDDAQKFSSRMSHFLWLCSDFGWSVYLNTVGKLDPSDVRPELVHVEMGVPTNKRTNERKLRIRDGIGIRRKNLPSCFLLETGLTYIPRAATKNSQRKEFWTATAREFELAIAVVLEFSAEWQRRGGVHEKEVDEVFGYRGMQDILWQALLTPDCEHYLDGRGLHDDPKETKLGSDAAALLGYNNAVEHKDPLSQRVLIFLTRGDPNLRWAALRTQTTGSRAEMGKGQRNPMLRTSCCCEQCALSHVASLPGRWSLIL